MAAAAAGVVGGHELWKSSAKSAAPVIGGLSSSGSNAGSPFSGDGGGTGLRLPYGGGLQGEGSGSSASGSASVSSAVVAKVSPALVNITTTLGYQSGVAAGTGAVLTSDGEVLTNNHVIAGATKIIVTDIGNGKTYTATVVGYDPSNDIAVIQLKGASGLETADLGDSSKAIVGTSVTGIGNAGGTGGAPSAAAGSISAVNQSITALDAFGGRPGHPYRT
jgi:S1-C subfamily serine protease